MSVDRAVWVRQAREVLAQTHPGARGDLVIVLERGRHRVRIECPEEAAAAEDGRPAPALSPIERAAVDVILEGGNRRLKLDVIKRRGRINAAKSKLYNLLGNLAEREPPVLHVNRAGYVVVGVLAEGRPAAED
jgi:hypothetical protein